MKKVKLKMLRVSMDLTQDEFAQKIGVSRVSYAYVENGKQNGTIGFWRKLQTALEIPDEKMWEIMK